MRAHPLVLVGITLIALASAAWWLSHKEPVYEATAEILVSPLPASDDVLLGLQLLRESNDPTRVTQTAAALLDADSVARLTSERLDGRLTPSDVREDVEIEPLGESNIIAVTGRAEDPRLAAGLANTYVDSALRARRDFLRTQVDDRVRAVQADATDEERRRLRQLQTIVESGDPTLTVAQPAALPEKPTGPSDSLVLLLAGIVGLGIGAASTIVMELTNRRIREPRDFYDLFPLPILARIPSVSHARMNRSSPASMPPAVHEAYRTLQVQVEQIDEHQSDPHVILFTSATAGDGKTSSAVQLALALASDGRSVILMDFDLRKPQLRHALGLAPSAGIVSLLTGRRRLEDVLQETPQAPDLRVVTTGGGEDDVLMLASAGDRLPRILREARRLADYVIIDTPPLGEVSDALRLLPHVDDVILIGRPNNTIRSDFESMRDLLDHMGVRALGLVLVGVGGLRGRYRTYGPSPSPPGRARVSSEVQPR